MRDLGNTLIVVEHDSDTMLASDYLVDIGPGAGDDGGLALLDLRFAGHGRGTGNRIVFGLAGIGILILEIIGIINALSGRAKRLPVIGGIDILK